MDRTKFLQICQKVSILKSTVCGIKQNVPDELKVVYDEIFYYPVAYELSFENGKTDTYSHIARFESKCNNKSKFGKGEKK